MVDATVQRMAWQNGEQERQVGGGGGGKSPRQGRSFQYPTLSCQGEGYDGGQGEMQKTRLTARWREKGK